MSIITITRGTFSGGKNLAECIAGKLGYRCLSREDLLQSASSLFGISEDKLSEVLQDTPGFWEGVSLRKIQYIAYVRAALHKAVKNDNVVYHGLAGNLLLRGIHHALRVRVITDMEFRIQAAMHQQNLSREKAIKFINKVDHDRATWVKSIYHVDWQSPSLYDLVINLAHISVPAACELVATAAKTSFQTTAESQKIVDDLVLSTEIRARIAANKGIEDVEVDVAADGGIVTITGKAESVAEAERIRQVALQTPGVREIKFNMTTRTSGRHDTMREFE